MASFILAINSLTIQSTLCAIDTFSDWLLSPNYRGLLISAADSYGTQLPVSFEREDASIFLFFFNFETSISISWSLLLNLWSDMIWPSLLFSQICSLPSLTITLTNMKSYSPSLSVTWTFTFSHFQTQTQAGEREIEWERERDSERGKERESFVFLRVYYRGSVDFLHAVTEGSPSSWCLVHISPRLTLSSSLICTLCPWPAYLVQMADNTIRHHWTPCGCVQFRSVAVRSVTGIRWPYGFPSSLIGVGLGRFLFFGVELSVSSRRKVLLLNEHIRLAHFIWRTW